jgi:phospholipase/carboxylesterase
MRMPAWYDIFQLGPGRQDLAGIEASAHLVESFLKREEERGIPASRIVLAGFSQGGSMALHVGDRYPLPLLGIMVLSGYQVVESPGDGANAMTPLLACHGTFDPLVNVEHGRSAFRAHALPGRRALWREFPMAHEVSVEEIGVIRDWLTGLFQGAPGVGRGGAPS